MKAERVSIESTAFTQLRMQFDSKLNILISKMIDKGVNDGKLTLQLEVHTEQGEAQDPDIMAEQTKETIIPMFRYKVTDAITLKSDQSGIIGDTEHELLRGPYSDGWYIGKVSDGQASLFDSNDELDNKEE